MRASVDLALLREGFFSLAQTPYFDPRLNSVASDIVGAIDVATSQQPPLDQRTISFFAKALWSAHKYLAGSTVSESPYEIEYCLRAALSDWVPDECVVATTLTTELDFHFWLLDIGAAIDNFVPTFARKANARLIPIAMPRLYKNRPLYCTPLYHELGHFIDKRYAVVELSLVRFPPSTHTPLEVERSHRAEYFSDLFAAQYVGAVAAHTLEQIAPGAPATASHPATADRVAIIQSLLSGSPNQTIEQFNLVLTQLALPNLIIRHVVPAVVEVFDDIRPCDLTDVAELHGLFPACWDYLEAIQAGANTAWAARDREFPEIDKVINGLLEKSIRNHSIEGKWRAASN